MATIAKLKLEKGADSESLVETLYQEIRDRICLLQYPPGMALREDALATEFGVSRTPIRHTLRRLEFEGLVDIGHRSGAIVTTVDLKFLKEVYALRLKLAEFVHEMMSARVSPEDIAALQELHEHVEAMRNQYGPETLARLYLDFHRIMTRMVNNKPLRQVSDHLFHQTSRVWLSILPDLDWEEEVNYFSEELRAVIEALRVGDTSTVGQVRRDHMVMLLRRTNNYLGGAELA